MTNYLLPVWLEPSAGWIIPLALVLDRLIGDPHALPHPVCLIGCWLRFLEKRLRPILPEFAAGTVGVLLALSGTVLLTGILVTLPSPASALCALYLAYAGLAMGQLIKEGENCLALIRSGDIAGSREALAMLVSRDLSRAGPSDLSRSLAETLSENFNDGFVAPLFWLVVGGPLGLWLYKCASTMDSMWGYPYPPWTLFGRTAAYLDDVLAFIPARLSTLCLLLSWRVQRNATGCWPGWKELRRQAGCMKSPNAGWPMAAGAWLVGASMGGPTVYDGLVVQKPILGPENKPWSADDLARLIHLLRGAASCALLVALLPLPAIWLWL